MRRLYARGSTYQHRDRFRDLVRRTRIEKAFKNRRALQQAEMYWSRFDDCVWLQEFEDKLADHDKRLKSERPL